MNDPLFLENSFGKPGRFFQYLLKKKLMSEKGYMLFSNARKMKMKILV